MRDFRQLQVWQKAHRLTLDIYRVSSGFPREEQFGLTSQVRRSAASVPANIAEGCGRDSEPDFARFLSVAGGSASETEYHLLLARDLGMLDEQTHAALDTQVNEVKKMLRALRSSLKANR
jgi:four helix bundle protein